MSDAAHRELLRQWQSDPENESFKLKLWASFERLAAHKPVAALGSLEVWRRCSETKRKDIYAQISSRLPEFLNLKGEYQNRPDSVSLGVFRWDWLGLTFHLLPGSWFRMGRDDGLPDEGPVHWRRVKPFLMSVWPLSKANWTLLPSNAAELSRSTQGDIQCGLTWSRVWQCFKVTGLLRFPMESEWEYACRAGGKESYAGPSEQRREYCLSAESLLEDTQPWEQRKNYRNDFGLVDMNGHVLEWCWDSAIGPYNPRSNPKPHVKPPETGVRVLRGGHLGLPESQCAASSRHWLKPSPSRDSSKFCGAVRPVIDLPEELFGEG